MSGVIGWLVGSGTLNDVTAKTSPLVTRGLGCHPRFFLLAGWTVGTINRAFLSTEERRRWAVAGEERRRWAVAGEDEGDPHG